MISYTARPTRLDGAEILGHRQWSTVLQAARLLKLAQFDHVLIPALRRDEPSASIVSLHLVIVFMVSNLTFPICIDGLAIPAVGNVLLCLSLPSHLHLPPISAPSSSLP